MATMNPHAPHLAIADPSLVDGRGHHFALTLQLTRGAQARGIPVTWLAHRDFVNSEPPPGVTVHKVFSATMYDRYRAETKGRLPPDLDRRLLAELEEGVAAAGLSARDHVYFHTGFGDVFRALQLHVQRDRAWEGPFVHVCTPYDHDTMPGKDPGPAVLEALRTFRALAPVDRKLFFWAETPQLARHYTATYGFNVRPMPLPAPWMPEPSAAPDATRPVTVLYLGAAREEKGFLHLPTLAERLYESLGRSGRLRFVVQCSPQIIGYLPAIRQAIERLQALPSSYVRLIPDVLSEEEYRSNLLECDIVSLLYDRKNYRIRGSGIAVEAVAADKCLLTFAGTFCASLVTEGGGCVVEHLDEAVDRLATMVERIGEYRARAQVQGLKYRVVNDAGAYAERILARGEPRNRSPFFPSTLVGRIGTPMLAAP